MQPDEVVLRINEVAGSGPEGAEVFVRCMTGELRLGATVRLTDDDHEAVSGPLTVEEIRLGPKLAVELLSPTYFGKLRLAGAVDRIGQARWVVGPSRG